MRTGTPTVPRLGQATAPHHTQANAIPAEHELPHPDLTAIAEEEEGGDLFVTPAPAEGGWPVIHGGKPDWQYENMTNDMTKLW